MNSTMPSVIIARNAADAAEKSARIAAEALTAGEVLGLATGATMLPLYHELARLMAGIHLPHNGVVGIALDEYVGIAPETPQSFAHYVKKHVMEPLGLTPERIVIPDAMAPDRAAAAQRHENAIRNAGGIGLQLLGIGANGHIAFNEPGASFDTRTRDVELAMETRAAQAPQFGNIARTPLRGITAGIGTILLAQRLLLLATGPAKASALAAALEGDISPACPASALRLHPAATIICDPAAAARLTETSRPDRKA